MPTTTKGTTLAVLSVDGENHLDGWVFSIIGGPDQSLFEISDSDVIVGLSTDYVSPGDKYITIQAVKGAITYQSGLTLKVGDKGVTTNDSTGSVNFPTNMIGNLQDTFSFRFAIQPKDTFTVKRNLLGVEGDTFGLVNVNEQSQLTFNNDKDTLSPFFTSATLTPNKWADVVIEGYNDGTSKIKVTLNDEVVFDNTYGGVLNFTNDLTSAWRVNGSSNDEFTIWSDTNETISIGTFIVDKDKFGVLGADVDHVSLTNSGAEDTYTVWGDVVETQNLGTFNVPTGSTVDHISYLQTIDNVYHISNCGASHLGLELVREDLSGSTGGMTISGNSVLMEFVVTDS